MKLDSLCIVQIEVLQAEVTALKALVITSTPSMPNRHLHPQIGVKKESKPTTGAFVKGHRRSTSHHNFSKVISPSTTEVEFAVPVEPEVTEEREVWQLVIAVLAWHFGLVDSDSTVLMKQRKALSLSVPKLWHTL